MVFIDKIKQIFKVKELRRNILFVLMIIVVSRLLTHIPLPGVNPIALRNFFNSNDVLGMLNLLSGGGMENFSIIMMGVGPYITASIILQLLTMIFPRLEESIKEPGGQEKMNMYTRYLTVPLAALQAFGMIKLLQNASQNNPILDYMNWMQLSTLILAVTAGTMFLVWLGDLITERKIGNGVSILILSGIVAGIPGKLQRVFLTYDPSQFTNIIIFILVALVTIVGIIFIAEGQRKIPISYARQGGAGRLNTRVSTYLPIPINQAGMIPIIFAASLVLIPTTAAQFLVKAQTNWLANTAQFILENLKPGQLIYNIMYFVLVVSFTYFYTYIVFHPDQMAENLQRQGGFIPGIRPGKYTQEYLQYVTNRILLTGSLFLGFIAVVPLMVQKVSNDPNLALSGASLLIVVGVIIEMINKIDAQLTMRDYEGF